MSEYKSKVLFTSNDVQYRVTPQSADKVHIEVQWINPEYSTDNRHHRMMGEYFKYTRLLNLICSVRKFDKLHGFFMDATEKLGAIAGQGFTFRKQTCEFDIIHPDGQPIATIWGYEINTMTRRRKALSVINKVISQYPSTDVPSSLTIMFKELEKRSKDVSSKKVFAFLATQPDVNVEKALKALSHAEALPADSDHVKELKQFVI